MTLRKRITIYIIILDAIIVIALAAVKFNKRILAEPDMALLPTYTFTSQDSILFQSSLDSIAVLEVFNSKARGPISRLLAPNKYILQIHELDTNTNQSLIDHITIEKTHLKKSFNKPYRVFSRFSNAITVAYKNIPSISPEGQIILLIDKSAEVRISNDTVLLIDSFKTLGIKYANEEYIDCWARLNDFFTKNEYTSLLIIKKSNRAYAIFVLSNHMRDKVKQDCLCLIWPETFCNVN